MLVQISPMNSIQPPEGTTYYTFCPTFPIELANNNRLVLPLVNPRDDFVLSQRGPFVLERITSELVRLFLRCLHKIDRIAHHSPEDTFFRPMAASADQSSPQDPPTHHTPPHPIRATSVVTQTDPTKD